MYSRFMESLMRPTLLIIAYIPSHHIRNFLYGHVFHVDMHKKAVLYYGAEIRAPWNLYIDEGAVVGDKSILDARSGIYIGKNVNISTGAWIWTLQHDVNSMNFTSAGTGAPVIIEDRAWLSSRTVVLPGVTLKEGSVIAAGAVVTKSTEPFTINGGVPCKKIGTRNEKINYELGGGHLHFL